MTVFLPLEASLPFPQSPSFLLPSPEPASQLKKVLKAIMKARRIVVVCGAGISVQAGIPDFRSPEGLFQSLKRDNPREALTSGKDLFDASVFNSEHTTSLFFQMIARLSELSQAAEPTPFHQVLRALDERGKLLRVYTQNIDAIESKSGLSFGVPERKSRSKGKPVEEPGTSEQGSSTPTQRTCRLPTPPAETPRCIPLHGTLQTLHCQTCTHSFPLEDHLQSLISGTPPQCPECTSLEATRQLIGKRARGVGKLRPSVVLYNETHKDGEEVGEVVRRDLVGSKGKGRGSADMLLVVGTSLRVPGTKRIVREFAKAVRCRGSASKETTVDPGLPTPSPSPRRSPASDEEPAVKTIYLNLDFPVPMREWEGVFDVWLQGDAQDFADKLNTEIERELHAKKLAGEKKRKREAEAQLAEFLARQEHSKAAKRKAVPESPSAGAKKRKIVANLSSLTKPKIKTKVNGKKPVPYAHTTKKPASPEKIMIRIPGRVKPLAKVEVFITSTPATCLAARHSFTTPGTANIPLTPMYSNQEVRYDPPTPRTTTRARWKASQAEEG